MDGEDVYNKFSHMAQALRKKSTQLVRGLFGKQTESVEYDRISIREKTLLIVKFSNDRSDEENQIWTEEFSEMIYEWLDDQETPILVLGLHDESGIEITSSDVLCGH